MVTQMVAGVTKPDKGLIRSDKGLISIHVYNEMAVKYCFDFNNIK